MTLYDLYSILLKCIRRIKTDYPKKRFKDSDGNLVSWQELEDSLLKQRSWLYPGLSTDTVMRVVFCKNCLHYQKKVKYCSKLKMNMREKDHCSKAIDREEDKAIKALIKGGIK